MDRIYQVEIQDILDRRKEVEELKRELGDLQAALEANAQAMIARLKARAEVNDGKYKLEIKLHDQLGYINWQKLFRDHCNGLYEKVKADAPRRQWEELVIF